MCACSCSTALVMAIAKHIYMYSTVCAGELVTKQPLIAGMRTVKKETLKLITCWVSKSQDSGMVSSTRLVCVQGVTKACVSATS